MSSNIAVSGIQAINEQLNVISGDIANTNTVGYRTRRANFAAMVSGTRIGSYSQNMDQRGASTRTNGALDAAISGGGFFAVRDTLGQLLYTRNGHFERDAQGLIVDGFGRAVQGLQSGVLGDLNVPADVLAPKASSRLDFSANLNSSWAPIDAAFNPANGETYHQRSTSTIRDALGGTHTLVQYFAKREGGAVDVYYQLDDATLPGAENGSFFRTRLEFDAGGNLTAPAQPVPIDLGAVNGQAMSIELNYAGTTRYDSDFSIVRNKADGYRMGRFASVSLEKDGSVVVHYDNEEQRKVGTVALAQFANAGGLEPQDDSAYAATRSSGDALYTVPGVAAAMLDTGALEGSNTELTAEMVDLMTAQRNYQANAKVLTADAEMSRALMQAL